MPNYKNVMRRAKAPKNELLKTARAVEPRADETLINNIVDYVCLPTPPVLDAICGALNCTPVELYGRDELDLLRDAPPPAAVEKRKSRRNAERESKLYNLTVELPRELAEIALNPAALKKLGYIDKSDFVRKAVLKAYNRLLYLQRKAADGNINNIAAATVPAAVNS